jgi:hypothetical protein
LGHSPGAQIGTALCGLDSATVGRQNAVRRSPFIVRLAPFDVNGSPLNDPLL